MLRFLCFFYFLTPLCMFSGFWWLISSLLFLISFVYLFFFPYFFLLKWVGLYIWLWFNFLWSGAENLASTGYLSPDRPTCSESRVILTELTLPKVAGCTRWKGIWQSAILLHTSGCTPAVGCPVKLQPTSTPHRLSTTYVIAPLSVHALSSRRCK